jgi:hypothetical protein
MVKAILLGRKTQTRRIAKSKPVYRVGERLWVRENFNVKGWVAGSGTMDIEYQDGIIKNCSTDFEGSKLQSLSLRILASKKYTLNHFTVLPEKRLRPSIHMPFGAHRVELEVTGVKKELLLSISEEDAIAEGIEPCGHRWKNYGDGEDQIYSFEYPASSFFTLWEKIYGCMDSDSFKVEIFAYTFKVVKQ